MTNKESPWVNMTESTQRRIDYETQYNLFWITDIQGNYGFCIQAKNMIINSDEKIKLKGISMIKRNSEGDYAELFLILKNKEDWQIFLVLCEDLIGVTKKYDTDEKMLCAVEIRLRRWQQLLRQDRNQKMTLEKQMGLFSELMCLKDVVAFKTGIKQAVTSWVGPEYDKQDFLLDNAAIEVKSYRTSKGENVQISSIQQLNSEKEPLFLISYALNFSENGLSIQDISQSIRNSLLLVSTEIMDVFENKLIEYGYIPELINEPLQKFIVDKQKVYHVVGSFPRITAREIKAPITSVAYSIDLSQCSEFEEEFKTFLGGGVSYD
jgi:hypothetical protein